MFQLVWAVVSANRNVLKVFVVEGDGIAHIKVGSCVTHELNEVAQMCPVNAIKVS